MRKSCGLLLLCSVLVCGFASVCSAIVAISNRGNWPEDWPKELEPLRQSSRTLGIGTGIQKNIYEIPIPDRETFDRIWPAIVKVRTPGSSLTFSRFDPKVRDDLFGNSHPIPIVRIHAPVNGSVRSHKDGHELRVGPPWPKEIVGKNGELPAYVVSKEDKEGQLHWVSGDPKQARGFCHRARVDVELVVDGKIIDLNRIELPDGVTIIDHRFFGK